MHHDGRIMLRIIDWSPLSLCSKASLFDLFVFSLMVFLAFPYKCLNGDIFPINKFIYKILGAHEHKQATQGSLFYSSVAIPSEVFLKLSY